ncbi:hypothetical protein J2Z65_006464 [Paenibacillus aceris]|uniref:Uncharacterized protein n=1 Tax=Paenibacillus aceris TaxID=869555 RepID=A0ABS4I8K6_9BACL|nr:hypothetical protein [Paenibacillus aceris]
MEIQGLNDEKTGRLNSTKYDIKCRSDGAECRKDVELNKERL